MNEKRKPVRSERARPVGSAYSALLEQTTALIAEARRLSARTVNAIMTATYWQIGRHIVEFEQSGEARASYGEELLKRLAAGLDARFGRGFSARNHLSSSVRLFYFSAMADLADSVCEIVETSLSDSAMPSLELKKWQTLSVESVSTLHRRPLPPSLVRLCPLAFGEERTRPPVLRS